MNGKITFKPRQLQQQPRRAANREQQQSSGFGELQPRDPGPAERFGSLPGTFNKEGLKDAAQPGL